MSHTNWIPGMVVLGAGLIAGILFVLFSRRGPAPAASAQDAVLADLEERYRMLIAQLKELTANQHLTTAEAFAADKLRLELDAAAALKARDQHLRGVRHEEAKSAARAEKRKQAIEAKANTFFGRNPALKGALWGAGTVLFFVILGVVLSRESAERKDGAGMTGAQPGAAAGASEAPPPEDPHFAAALERLSKNPEDLETLAEVGHGFMLRQQFEEAKTLTDRAIAIDPFHVETRIHRAVLRAFHGEGAQAMKELMHLADTYPGAHEALLYAGALSMQINDKKRALESFERYLAEAPASDQPPMLREGIRQLREQIAQGGHP